MATRARTARTSHPPSSRHACSNSGPAARWIAPSTPPPPSSELAGRLALNATDAELDLDGDGLNNLREYRAGTNPTDPNSRFELVEITKMPNGMAAMYRLVPKREDLLAFHQRWFFPSNYVLAVSGDFEREAMVKKLETLFASQPLDVWAAKFATMSKRPRSWKIFLNTGAAKLTG